MPKFSRRRGCGKQAAAKKGYKRSIKTANRSKDIDQIQDEFIALSRDPRKAVLPVDPDRMFDCYYTHCLLPDIHNNS